MIRRCYSAASFSWASTSFRGVTTSSFSVHHHLPSSLSSRFQSNTAVQENDSFLDHLSPKERTFVALKRRAREQAKADKKSADEFLLRLRSGSSFSDPQRESPLMSMVMSRIFDDSLPPLRLNSIFHAVTTGHHLLPENRGCNRRLARLAQVSKMLRFLLDHNVLLHAVVRFHPRTRTWNVTPSYPRLVSLGQSRIATEANLRVSKVFPNATLPQLQALEDAVVEPRFLASLFDTAGFNRLVHPREARQMYPLSVNQKATLLCAMLAELRWFVDRTRPTNRTHNNALFPPSDVLILHGLAAHSLECLMGELLWHLLGPVAERVAMRWRNLDTSLVEQLDLAASKAELASQQEDDEDEKNSSSSAASQSDSLNKRLGLGSANSNQSGPTKGGKAAPAGDNSNKKTKKQPAPSYFLNSSTSWRWKTARLEAEPRRRTYSEFADTRDGFGRQIERASVFLRVDSEPRTDGFFSPTPAKLNWKTHLSKSVDVEDDSAALVEKKKKAAEILLAPAPVPGSVDVDDPTAEQKQELLSQILQNGFTKTEASLADS